MKMFVALFVVGIILPSCDKKNNENSSLSPEHKKALEQVSQDRRAGMEFLIKYMPDRDREELSADYLLEHVNLAYEARNAHDWAKNIPEEIFLNDVLPYASFNEKRESWRRDFRDRFSKYVNNSQTLEEAVRAINENAKEELEVIYSTERPKPDQAPQESMSCGLASCTGLSVLLVDAFRSVGIPARIAGTPNWTQKQGNHNWVEVWIDGVWYFTEYYFDDLDQAWFLNDAGQANPNDKKYWIYATSFKPTSDSVHFPLVWDLDIQYVNAENVTDRYISIYKEKNEEEKAKLDGKAKVEIKMFKDNVCSQIGDNRVSEEVQVFDKDGNLQGEGVTSAPEEDMNKILTMYLAKNKIYNLRYKNSSGKLKVEELNISEDKYNIVLFFNE